MIFTHEDLSGSMGSDSMSTSLLNSLVTSNTPHTLPPPPIHSPAQCPYDARNVWNAPYPMFGVVQEVQTTSRDILEALRNGSVMHVMEA